MCRDVVSALAERLRAEYVSAAKGEEMARALGTWLDAGSCNTARTARELAHTLTTDLQALCHDKHLRVFYGPPPMGPGHDDRGVGGIRKREILDGNVGYLETTGVPSLPESEGPIAEAFAYLHDTEALILDVRANGGGDPITVARYISYLSEGPPYVINRFEWRNAPREEFFTTDLGARSYGARKPVYVLTSKKTFSGGEELAYDLQAAKRAVLIGETTGGGANPGGPRPLPHGFDVGVPMGRAVNAITGTNWEGTGVKPDVAVPADQALDEAHRAALARLKAMSGQPVAPTSESKPVTGKK
ncbi:MAG TPA: S41 family peptidase [Polyangiaceae bacterium]|nr:S41 family peptidase [Polyangiaceae bacterium]